MARSPKSQIRTSRSVFSPARGFCFLGMAVALICSSFAQAGPLEEMSLDRWKKLREVERYQLNIAEKYYGEKNWKVAAAEYEKYLTLYERSEAGSYAQLKWSICQSNLKNKNTAISEGFQSVVDYWPDSADAVSAAFYIGKTYEEIGEVSKAKKAYNKLLTDYGKHDVAAFALDRLWEISNQENDVESCIKWEEKLTFDIDRTKHREIRDLCVKGSVRLASHYFDEVAFDKGVKALETTYDEKDIVNKVVDYATGSIRKLTANQMTKAKGDKLVDLAVAYVKTNIPSESSTPEEKQRVLQHWYHIANMEAAAGHEEEVPKVYEEILKKFGQQDQILSRYAGWYESLRKFDQARAIYARFENKIEGQSKIASTYRSEKRVEPAVRVYQNLVAADPDNEFQWLEQMAVTYRENNMDAKAIEVFQQLLKNDVDQIAKWLNALGHAYEDTGNFKLAIAHFRQITDDKYMPGNYYDMARCHIKLKQYGEAISLYNQIVGGWEPHAPRASYEIADTFKLAKQKEQAIKQFQAVCQRYPKTSYAAKAHALLQKEYNITVTLGGAKNSD